MGTKNIFKHYVFLLFIVSGLLLASCGSSDGADEQKMDAPTNESVEKKADEEGLDVESPKDDFIAHDQFEEPMHLMFSSGAGAWGTVIELSSDGSFTGIYKDANGGESGNGYVSTTYISEFTGHFGDIQQLDAETYAMKLVTLDYQDEDTEWIENNTKYIAAEPYGFEEGKDFFLYSPQKNIESLNDNLLSWGSGHGGYDSSLNELQYWVLHNETTDYGFFSEKYANEQETESNEPVVTPGESLPVNFELIDFDPNYSGPGSEFIGIWHEDNASSVEFAPNPWEIKTKDGLFYIRAELPGDPGMLVMTATFEEGKLYSTNGVHIDSLEYVNQATLEVELPETIEPGELTSEFFIENNRLQWISYVGDLRDALQGTEEEGAFKRYQKE